MLIITAPTEPDTPTDYPFLVDDALLQDAGDGVIWLTRMDYPGCYDGTTPVVNGAVVTNMGFLAADSAMVVTSGGLTIAGNGLAYDAATVTNNYMTIPSAVASAIAANDQNFLCCLYFKLPSEANWPTTTSQSNPIMNWCATGNYGNDIDLLTFGLVLTSGNPVVVVRRQNAFATGVGTAAAGLNLGVVGSGHPGQICQIAFWRDAAGEYSSIRSMGGSRITNTAARSPNTAQDIGALTGKIGVLPAWATIDAAELTALDTLRFYGGFFELLEVSGRTALDVLEADFAANIEGGEYYLLMAVSPRTFLTQAGAAALLIKGITEPFIIPPTGEYVLTTVGGGTTTTTLAGLAGRIDMFPWTPRAAFTSDLVACNCTTAVAAAQGKFVLYSADASGRPNLPLIETATVDLSTTGVKTAALAYAFQPGVKHWLGFRHSSTATISAWPVGAVPDINGGTAPVTTGRKMLRRTLAFATAPSSPWGWLSTEIAATSPPAIWLRVA